MKKAKDNLLKEKNLEDKLLLKTAIFNLGKLAWKIITLTTYLTMIVFILITCSVFWLKIGAENPELLIPIVKMIATVKILLLILTMDVLVRMIKGNVK